MQHRGGVPSSSWGNRLQGSTASRSRDPESTTVPTYNHHGPLPGQGVQDVDVIETFSIFLSPKYVNYFGVGVIGGRVTANTLWDGDAQRGSRLQGKPENVTIVCREDQKAEVIHAD